MRIQQPFLRRLLAPLKHTILHPQWLVLRNQQRNLTEIASHLRGRVLDIGCADQKLKPLLVPNCDYIGLDYLPMVMERYGTEADIYGDAQCLPLRAHCIDSVVLLDVLEHLPEPNRCVQEIARVLKPGGLFILQVPFLYPIHDAPFDFQRWTHFGLRQLLQAHGFTIEAEIFYGHPSETAGLMVNLALARAGIEWTSKVYPGVLLLPLLVLLIPLVNLITWLLACAKPQHVIPFMPLGFRLICRRS